MRIHDEVWQSLGVYIYAYVDPESDLIKYIGKGVGDRALAHLSDPDLASTKVTWINEIKAKEKAPRIDILARNLTDENALLLERTLIDAFGFGDFGLTNKIRGQGVETGRESIEEIAIRMNPQPAVFRHNVLMLRLNRHWRPNLSKGELYDITRGIWELGPRRETVVLVLAVAHGIVREVFIPESWYRAGTTPYEYVHPDMEEKHSGRWEFVGKPATQPEHREYLGKDVSWFYKKGEQTSRRYAGPDKR
jgi:hypothetical protein